MPMRCFFARKRAVSDKSSIINKSSIRRSTGVVFCRSSNSRPAFTQPPRTSEGAGLPRINGGRTRTNEYLFDGISVLQPEPGQIAFFPIVDATQEFEVEINNPPAEFGRFNGGVINLSTKAGTKRFSRFGFRVFPQRSFKCEKSFHARRAKQTGFSPQSILRRFKPDRLRIFRLPTVSTASSNAIFRPAIFQTFSSQALHTFRFFQKYERFDWKTVKKLECKRHH